MKYFIVIFLLLLNYWLNNTFPEYYPEPEPEAEIDTTRNATVAAVGDLMCHSTQFNYARVNPDSFDFKPVFKEVKKLFDTSDFVIGNLETAFGGKKRGYKGYPIFNTPDEFLAGLSYAGFDLLINANNHALDMGKKGLLRTVERVKDFGMDYNGTFISKNDADSLRIYSVNGIRIALLAYTYGTNGMSDGSAGYVVNEINESKIADDVARIRLKEYDVLVVSYHFGDEYARFPSEYQKKLIQNTVDLGVDIIIGSHPHVVQPVEFFKTKNGKLDSGFVAYSLGNFISNQRWRYSDGGVILNFELEKNTISGRVGLNQVGYMPVWVFKGDTKKGREYIILPAEYSFRNPYPDFLTEKDIAEMKQSFFDTMDIIEKFSDKPVLTSFFNLKEEYFYQAN